MCVCTYPFAYLCPVDTSAQSSIGKEHSEVSTLVVYCKTTVFQAKDIIKILNKGYGKGHVNYKLTGKVRRNEVAQLENKYGNSSLKDVFI